MKRPIAGSVGALVLLAAVLHAQPTVAGTTASTFCKPTQSCWPTDAEWRALAKALTGTLVPGQSPLEPCKLDVAGAACAAAIEQLKNPFEIQEQPGGTESLGWLDAWTASPGAYVVAAQNAQDIAAAVTFARDHKLRLVIRGAGHDYLGRSSAPDSLVIWTHQMHAVTVRDAFVAAGCPATQAAAPAVTIEAGATWFEVNQEVMVKHGRYVAGGGCLSVGAAGGFTQGGGFGVWSKRFGTAAGNLLEAEVVTANGKRVVANACQNQDLFWALRGGGGGTFGVVTRVTQRTDPLPEYFGAVIGTISAKTDAGFVELIERFLRFYRSGLSNASWGDKVVVDKKNSLRIGMSFSAMSAKDAELVWKPLRTFVEQHPDRFTISLQFQEAPGNKIWDLSWMSEHAPGALTVDKRGRAWWSSTQGEVATYWYAYQSRYLPIDRFEGDAAKSFAHTLFDASRQWSLELHFHKGQAGAAPDAVARDRATSINPAVFKAAGLLIVAADGKGYPGVRGREPDREEGRAYRTRVAAAMKIVRDATPGAGSYPNETDFFEPDWQQEFWGDNYAKLLAIKQKYDPEGLFVCHHCVGSDR